MFYGFNQGTTLKNSNLEKDIEYTEKYKFDYIEFQMSQLNLYLEKHSINDMRVLFKNKRIKPFSLNVLEFFNLKTTMEFAEVKKEFIRMCKIAKEIDCCTVIIVPSKKTKPISQEEIREDSIKSINQLADIADNYNIKIAYEFIGFSYFSVNNFTQCYDIIKAVDRKNVGIVLDCFHFYASDSKIEELQIADGNKIFVFHVDDSKDLPLNILTDADRVWPGDGVAPLDKIFSTLKSIGFEGVATIELFNPEYWKWDAEKTIRVSKEKLEQIVKKFF